jgi:hypothetical protein
MVRQDEEDHLAVAGELEVVVELLLLAATARGSFMHTASSKLVPNFSSDQMAGKK